MGKIVNQTELAEIVGVTDVTLWSWDKEDPPIPIAQRGERGTAHSYDTGAVIEWMIMRAVKKVSSETQKDRLVRLQADMLEIELAREKRELVPFNEVEPAWQLRVLSAASFLSSQHSRLAGILEATPGIEGKREVIKEQFTAFLNRLGVDGARMHEQVEELVAKVSASEAEAFFRRIAGHDEKPDPQGGTQPGVGPVPPAG